MCLYTEDKLDELKSSPNVSEATFGRFQEIATSIGLDAFENTAFLIEYILIKVFQSLEMDMDIQI